MADRFCTHCGAELVADANICRTCGTPVKHPLSPPQDTSHSTRLEPPDARRSTGFAMWWVTGIGLLVLLGALMHFNTPGPGPTTGTLPDVHDAQGVPYPKVIRIPLREAKARFETKTALFVDVRSRESYEAAHIPNAVSLPLADLEGRYQELPQDAEILTYCS